MPEKIISDDIKCSLKRRLAACFYDSLCLLSLFFVATMCLIIFNGGDSVDSNNFAYDFYLLLIAYFYFVWHWVNGGQTLGMRAWRIKAKTFGGNSLTWRTATRRYALALISVLCLGLGFVWAIFDSKKLAFHDRYSHTYLIHEK